MIVDYGMNMIKGTSINYDLTIPLLYGRRQMKQQKT